MGVVGYTIFVTMIQKLINLGKVHTSTHPYAICTALATCGRSGTGQEFILHVVTSCMLFNGCEDTDDCLHRTGPETSEAACLSGMHGLLNQPCSLTAMTT